METQTLISGFLGGACLFLMLLIWLQDKALKAEMADNDHYRAELLTIGEHVRELNAILHDIHPESICSNPDTIRAAIATIGLPGSILPGDGDMQTGGHLKYPPPRYPFTTSPTGRHIQDTPHFQFPPRVMRTEPMTHLVRPDASEIAAVGMPPASWCRWTGGSICGCECKDTCKRGWSEDNHPGPV